MRKRVSIALCTFNGEKFIKEQVVSIINQTRLPEEIVICDDLSNDKTVDIINQIALESNVEIKLYINKERLGVTKNFDKAISLCSGEVILLSDQDDFWINTKIEKILKVFENFPDVDILFSDALIVDENLNKKDILSNRTINKSKKMIERREFLKAMLKNNVMTGMTMAFSKKIKQYISPIDNLWIHDYWIGIIGSTIGEVYYCNEQLVLYRQHVNNLIGSRNKTYYRKFVQNIQKIEKYRQHVKNMYDMFKALSEKINNMNLDPKKQVNYLLIKKAETHWKNLENLKKLKRIKAFGIILNELFKLNYYKYNIGFQGFMRDGYNILKREKKAK